VAKDVPGNVVLFWIGMVYGSKRPYDFVSVADLPY
jgi:hypothetical protein